ncbi:hypothetical protein DSO57_1020069 [Entomophthora muscae]|uniref:Uncharacterized protein n=1 Tax=Entomophthora muscae TaxID=34485 RepID=A0ACC2TRB7_9FUNG|nr:hypothetical protein DSO57_1020069 [Entomophthora muscae]
MAHQRRNQNMVNSGIHNKWYKVLVKFKFQYKFINGIDNHLADSLSHNPAFVPDVKDEQKFNTKVMILPSTILSSPPKKTICTLSVQEPVNPDLVARVKLLQPLDEQYPQLFKLANQFTPHTCYSSEDSTILHNGYLWVPDSDICLEVIKAHHEKILVGHQGKNKTIEIIHRQFD